MTTDQTPEHPPEPSPDTPKEPPRLPPDWRSLPPSAKIALGLARLKPLKERRVRR